MTKRELIDKIVAINKSASPSFLARFDDVQLDEYLAHLRVLETPRLSGSARKYEKYFRNCPTIHAPRPLWRTDSAAVEEIAAEELDGEEPPAEEFEAEPVEEFAEGFVEQPVGPAEREQLYVESMDAEVEDEEELACEPEAPDEPVAVGTFLEDGAEDAEDELDEADQAREADDESETEVAVAAAAETDRAETPFADQEEDSEAWLY
jgi:hypothetical protein